MIATSPARRSFVVVLCSLVGLALACSPPPAAPGGDPNAPLVGKAAPAFELKTLEDSSLSLASYRGKVVLLDFWATWCKPCHEQTKILTPLYAELKGQGVEFLAVNSGEEEDTVRSFVADTPFTYPVLLDPEDSLAAPYGVQALPTLVVVDREGKVTLFQEGISDAAELRREIARAGA